MVEFSKLTIQGFSNLETVGVRHIMYMAVGLFCNEISFSHFPLVMPGAKALPSDISDIVRSILTCMSYSMPVNNAGDAQMT